MVALENGKVIFVLTERIRHGETLSHRGDFLQIRILDAKIREKFSNLLNNQSRRELYDVYMVYKLLDRKPSIFRSFNARYGGKNFSSPT